MKQKTAATIFTAIIFIICVVILRMHFTKPTASETITTANYYIDNLKTPQVQSENQKYKMTVTASHGSELYVEITNNTKKDLKLDERFLLYTVSVDGTRYKVAEKGIKTPIIRGYGRSEIVKSIPAQGTREVVFDCSSLGVITPGSYVILIKGQYLFFTLEDNPAV